MNSIYIGDRQLDPDDEFECPHCGCLACGPNSLAAHIRRCPTKHQNEEPSDDREQ